MASSFLPPSPVFLSSDHLLAGQSLIMTHWDLLTTKGSFPFIYLFFSLFLCFAFTSSNTKSSHILRLWTLKCLRVMNFGSFIQLIIWNPVFWTVPGKNVYMSITWPAKLGRNQPTIKCVCVCVCGVCTSKVASWLPESIWWIAGPFQKVEGPRDLTRCIAQSPRA
jgi:hypothetical protein